jgi:hypothetical protein
MENAKNGFIRNMLELWNKTAWIGLRAGGTGITGGYGKRVCMQLTIMISGG